MKRIPKRYIILAIIAVLAIGGLVFFFNRDKSLAYETFTVKRENISEEVSVTGKVKAAQNIGLAFEGSGRIGMVFVKLGDRVLQGDSLVSLENADILAQLAGAKANAEAEMARLEELKKGTRPEELRVARTKVATAQNSVEDALASLGRVESKAEADMNSVNEGALSEAQKAVIAGKASLMVISDIQDVHFRDTGDSDSVAVAAAKAEAMKVLLGVENAGWWNSSFISPLQGGAFKTVQNAVSNPIQENIDKALSEAGLSLQSVKQALDAVPPLATFTAADRTNLSSEKSTISAEIVVLSGKVQVIAVQKATNNSAITTAKTNVNSAENALKTAQDDLALLEAGATLEQLAIQEAKVKSVLAVQGQYEAALAKSVLKAPFNGVVARQEARVGEIISSGTPLVSLISQSAFQVEATVPEVDAVKIKQGDKAEIQLDAYRDEVLLHATVILVDIAGVEIEGVPTYKVTLEFEKEDERVLSGMTADVSIITNQRDNVLVVPQRAVITKNGAKTIKVLENGEIKEKEIQTGIRGSSGNVEIMGGLSEGEVVITFMPTK